MTQKDLIIAAAATALKNNPDPLAKFSLEFHS